MTAPIVGAWDSTLSFAVSSAVAKQLTPDYLKEVFQQFIDELLASRGYLGHNIEVSPDVSMLIVTNVATELDDTKFSISFKFKDPLTRARWAVDGLRFVNADVEVKAL